jgi:putative holliday junction resolvase
LFILGIDFGNKYIGIGIGNIITKTATPIASILSKKNTNNIKLLSLVDYWKPFCIIIGHPSDLKKNKNILSKINKFIKNCENLFNIPVYKINEDLSTWKVKNEFFTKKNFNNNDFLNINALSAVILIKQWLDDHEIKKE